jgi:sugar/nucleoside kinase (ribokinase family)
MGNDATLRTVNVPVQSGQPEEASPHPLDVVGMGSSLVDVVSTVDDETIDRLGLERGTMMLVDLAVAEGIYAEMGPTVEVSGGSAANTVAGVAALGGAAAFVGKIAADPFGEVFAHDIRAAGVEFRAAVHDPGDAGEVLGTGRCLVLVTADADRTMATHLGAATTITPADVPLDLVERGRVLYLEGYLWDMDPAKQAMRRAIEVAHDHDGAVAFSLSDPFCVERHRREFLDLVAADVDVLFGNEEEMCRLFDVARLREALTSAEDLGILVAATRGPAGSIVLTGTGHTEIDAMPVDEVVDTTGAGDLYAAGFLYGLTHGLDPAACARLGSVCAAEVVSHLGARPQKDLVELARDAGLL